MKSKVEFIEEEDEKKIRESKQEAEDTDTDTDTDTDADADADADTDTDTETNANTNANADTLNYGIDSLAPKCLLEVVAGGKSTIEILDITLLPIIKESSSISVHIPYTQFSDFYSALLILSKIVVESKDAEFCNLMPKIMTLQALEVIANDKCPALESAKKYVKAAYLAWPLFWSILEKTAINREEIVKKLNTMEKEDILFSIKNLETLKLATALRDNKMQKRMANIYDFLVSYSS